MDLAYFIARFEALPEETWGYQSCLIGGEQSLPKLDRARVAFNKGRKRLSDLLTGEEYDALALMLGTHAKAINDGELDYFMLGSTPKTRMLAVLRKFAQK